MRMSFQARAHDSPIERAGKTPPKRRAASEKTEIPMPQITVPDPKTSGRGTLIPQDVNRANRTPELAATSIRLNNSYVAPASKPAREVFPRKFSTPLPRVISWGNLTLAEAGCLLLLAATFYMPIQGAAANWWTNLKIGSPVYNLPVLLRNWQVLSAMIGMILLPFLRPGTRAKLVFGISLSVLGLMTLAILCQYRVGFSLVFLPTLGLLSLAALYAVLRARTLNPQAAFLQRWQTMTASAAVVLWSLPALGSFFDNGIRNIFSVAGAYSPWLSLTFSLGATAAAVAAALALGETKDHFHPRLNCAARAMAGGAMLMLVGAGFAVVSMVSEAFFPSLGAGWFGVGTMWLFLLVIACMMLFGSGMVQQFGLLALNYRQEEPLPRTD